MILWSTVGVVLEFLCVSRRSQCFANVVNVVSIGIDMFLKLFKYFSIEADVLLRASAAIALTELPKLLLGVSFYQQPLFYVGPLFQLKQLR